MKNIGLLGAFDRHNYGDLLFPLIIKNRILQHDRDYNFNYYGILESDLSRYGGVKTRSIYQLFDQERNDIEDVIIIAGGDVLNAPWYLIYKYLAPVELMPIFSALEQKIPRSLLFSIYPTDIRDDYYLPFVLSKLDFKNEVKIIYNAVGGSNVGNDSQPFFHEAQITKCISLANYASVRDKTIFNWLSNNCNDPNLFLIPDSASLISRFYPKKKLEKLANPDTLLLINRYDKYLCFQVNTKLGNKYFNEIVEQIEKIYIKFGIPTILCPMGTASGHEDQVILEKINRSTQTPCLLNHEYGIFDIMTIISHSSLFAGTSLHGAITAMSYCVPNLGFKYVPKLKRYLETWAIPDLRECIEFSQLFSKIEVTLSMDRQLLFHKQKELIKLVDDSFGQIVKIINCEVVSDNQISDFEQRFQKKIMFSEKENIKKSDEMSNSWMLERILDLERKVQELNFSLSEFENIELINLISIYRKIMRFLLSKIRRSK